jgi:hypothetical protein
MTSWHRLNLFAKLAFGGYMQKPETTKEHLLIYRVEIYCRSMEGDVIRENFSLAGNDYQDALRKAVEYVDNRKN